MQVKDRVIGLIRVKGSNLVPHPRNWKRHPEAQGNAMRGILADVGYADALKVVERDGKYILWDGHMRAEITPDMEVPVLLTDLTDDEVLKVLATHDPIATMAESDSEIMDGLLRDVSTQNEALQAMLDQIQADIDEPFRIERVAVDRLRPHARNYKEHPPEQLAHIIASLKENGFYRNVIVASDYTILAGHGVWQAAKVMGLKTLPVIRLALDPMEPRALKVLVSDNEISRLAKVDEIALTDMLKQIMQEHPTGLEGAGLNAEQLAAMSYIARPASEIQNKDEAAEWVGMPEYDESDEGIQVIVNFDSFEDRDKFLQSIEAHDHTIKSKNLTWSLRWPLRDRSDLKSLKVKG